MMELTGLRESRIARALRDQPQRFDFRVDGYDWYDADGPLDLRAERIGKICTFWLPEQEGYSLPQLLRSHTAKAKGASNGDPVEACFMLDII